MRNILFATAAVFIFLGAASLLVVFLMPWLLAYGFSAPAGLMLVLGGVILVAMAAQIDAIQKVESAIYGLQKSLRHAAPASVTAAASPPADAVSQPCARPQPSDAPVMKKAERTVSGASAGEVKERKATAGEISGEGKRRLAPEAEASPEKSGEPHVHVAAAMAGSAVAEKVKEVPPARPQNPVAVPPVREENEAVAVPPGADADKGEKSPAPAPAGEKEATASEHAAAGENDETTAGDAGGAQASSAEKEKGFLYIVREETVRGRRARVLSDGTIEAELDDGWLRFENMDHLNEYLDALEELRKKGMI